LQTLGQKELVKPKPTDKQLIGTKIILNNIYEDILFDGAARAGKTFNILFNLVLLSLKYPDLRILIARERLSHAISSLWLQSLIPMVDKYFHGLYEENKTQHILKNKINDSEIWLGGLDTKERAEKIFGQEYGIIFLNEAVQLGEKTIAKIQTRLAQKIVNLKNFMIFDCNPRSPAHWIYQKFYIDKPKDSIRLTWYTKDNLENISETLINRLEQLPETERRRYLLGEWCEVEGAVYNNIHDKNISNLNKDWGKYDDIVIGIDWGYHTHASIWGIKQEEKLQAYCLYDFALIGSKTSDLIIEMDKIEWLKRYKCYCDHELDRIDEMCDKGYIAVKAYKEVGAGDSSVNEYDLYFDNKCNETFQSMLNLMHQQDKNENYIDAHEKVNDHGADSARYALHGWRKDNEKGKGHYFIKR